MPLNFRSLSLRTKLVVLFGVLLAALAIFLMLFFPARMDSQAQRWIKLRAVGIAVVLANAVAPGLEFDDSANVAELLNGLASSPEVVYASVARSDGSLLAAWNKEKLPGLKVALAEEPVAILQGGLLHVFARVRGKGGASGTLSAGFSLVELEKEKRANLWVVGMATALVFLVGLGMSFVTGTVLVRPIRKLTEVTGRIVRESDLTQEIHLTSGDESGVLADRFRDLIQKLRSILLTLKGSVQEVTSAASDLSQVTKKQTELVQRQAVGLTEASGTTQEIKQTSALAASKAETVLQVAAKAEKFSITGQASVEASLKAIEDIRGQVNAIASKIGELSEQTLQVGEIIESVKDLADQSDILALNAAIEAVRAGEFGKGFTVVAREIRSLANQSSESTDRIREILSQIQGAIRSLVEITGEGTLKMERGMEQIRSSGESMREMATIIQASAQAARQIATSVNQQNTGISQISGAIVGLNRAMEETVSGIRDAEQASENLKVTSSRISEILASFRA